MSSQVICPFLFLKNDLSCFFLISCIYIINYDYSLPKHLLIAVASLNLTPTPTSHLILFYE